MYGLKKLGEIIKPDMIVTTGTSPHERQHDYWRLDEPCHDMTLWRSWQSEIAAQYDNDPVVINPSRIMRVAGTVSYPSDKKRKKDYIAELVTLEVCDQEQSQLHAIEAWGEIILPLTATKTCLVWSPAGWQRAIPMKKSRLWPLNTDCLATALMRPAMKFKK